MSSCEPKGLLENLLGISSKSSSGGWNVEVYHWRQTLSNLEIDQNESCKKKQTNASHEDYYWITQVLAFLPFKTHLAITACHSVYYCFVTAYLATICEYEIQITLHFCNLRHPLVARDLRLLMEESGLWRKEDLTSCPELRQSTWNYVSIFLTQHNQWNTQGVIMPVGGSGVFS